FIKSRNPGRFIITMKGKILVMIIFVCQGFLFGETTKSVDIIDGIVAVIGDVPILYSDVERRAMEFAYYEKKDIGLNKSLAEEYRKKAFKSLYENAIFLMAAKEDSTIFVQENEILEKVNAQISNLNKAYPDQKEQETYLRTNGFKNKEEYVKLFKKEVEEGLYIQYYTRRYIMTEVKITNDEIKKFYNENKEKQTLKQDQYHVGQFIISTKASKEEQERMNILKNKILQEIAKGENFSEVARNYTEGPNKANGGDIGMVTNMEASLFQQIKHLQTGQISNWIFWKGSWWLFKVTERIEDNLRVSLILLKPKQNTEVFEKAKLLTEEALSEYKKGTSLVMLKDKFKEAKQVDLGWLTETNMADLGIPADIRKMKDNEATDVGSSESSFQFYVLFKKENKECTLDQLYEDIKRILRIQKMQKLIENRISLLKKQIYIKVFEPYDKLI
ncbi:MAG: peptidylprolyl isomerase, partial [Candidatus Coatesbacteria bacterium]|nr:peptidylprolyl isomerase [Candidatus Coatesbacteria bacterium]